MKHRYTTMLVAVCCLAGIVRAAPSPAQERDTQILLSRLDLSQPGLEQVKESIETPAIAAKELLAYYRARTSVKHPTARPSKIGQGRGARERYKNRR